MQTIHVLLVDSKDAVKKLLEQELLNAESMKFVVTLVSAATAKNSHDRLNEDIDVIFIGEKTSPSAASTLGRTLRSRYPKAAIFMLTKESEARLSRKLDEAGIDDMLNIAEMRTPLFAWTFTSVLEHAEAKKKVKDYDVLRHRLKHLDTSLGDVMHKISNPLSVIRLSCYHLENPNLTKDKRELFFKLMMENVKKIDAYMNELRAVRRRLGEDANIITKILSLKEVRQVVSAR